jgi:glycosyltransferase involved in cell wall biosynthesis
VRILLATDWMSPAGGIESHIRLMSGALAAAGDEVRTLASRGASQTGGGADYVAYGSDRRAAQAVLQIANPFAAGRMRQAVREFQPDVVHVHMFEMHLSPAVVAATGRVPTVLSVGYYKPVCPIGLKLLPDDSLCTHRAGLVCRREGCVGLAHWLRDRPRYRFIRGALAGAASVHACSHWLARELARFGIGADVVYLPARVPEAGFRRAPAAEPRFVFVGRLCREKGVAHLIRAFREVRAAVPEATLRIVGNGPEREPLERLAAELGLGEGVTFSGELDDAGVDRELEQAWGLVSPSLWAEPLGLSAVEAVIRGVPVVASSAGGPSEVVEDGAAGLLFPNGDTNALARSLLRFARREVFPTLQPDPGAVARAARRHDLDAHVANLRGIYADLVSAPGRVPTHGRVTPVG